MRPYYFLILCLNFCAIGNACHIKDLFENVKFISSLEGPRNLIFRSATLSYAIHCID